MEQWTHFNVDSKLSDVVLQKIFIKHAHFLAMLGAELLLNNFNHKTV